MHLSLHFEWQRYSATAPRGTLISDVMLPTLCVRAGLWENQIIKLPVAAANLVAEKKHFRWVLLHKIHVSAFRTLNPAISMSCKWDRLSEPHGKQLIPIKEEVPSLWWQHTSACLHTFINSSQDISVLKGNIHTYLFSAHWPLSSPPCSLRSAASK